MFGTTTWPIAMTQPHAAPAGGADPHAPVLRVRVSRRTARSHRARRDVRLPRIGRGGTYVVRVCRPAGCDALRIERPLVGTPHRERVAR